jgi:hypothetical protein
MASPPRISQTLFITLIQSDFVIVQFKQTSPHTSIFLSKHNRSFQPRDNFKSSGRLTCQMSSSEYENQAFTLSFMPWQAERRKCDERLPGHIRCSTTFSPTNDAALRLGSSSVLTASREYVVDVLRWRCMKMVTEHEYFYHPFSNRTILRKEKRCLVKRSTVCNSH